MKEQSVRVDKAEQNERLETNNSKTYLQLKRLIDIGFSFLGLILLSPVMLVIALFILLEDRNERVIFKQLRVGVHGKPFYMYKFRSMISDAELLKKTLIEKNEATGPVFKMRNDPRVTTFGKFIRKTSMDELPQLVNVLKGEMSLVGPRPPLPDEVAQYTDYQMQRLEVVPGLTCYWQVNGRSDIPFEEWVDMDIQYIRQRGFWLDIKLILKTIIVLLKSKGAY